MKRTLFFVTLFTLLGSLFALPVEARTKRPAKKIPMNGTEYVCSYNAYNCSHFKTREDAQKIFLACGGVQNDIHRMDRNKNGVACEGLI